MPETKHNLVKRKQLRRKTTKYTAAELLRRRDRKREKRAAERSKRIPPPFGCQADIAELFFRASFVPAYANGPSGPAPRRAAG